MMARRTAGRLGEGGGPGTRGWIFPRPRPAVRGEAQVLQIGERNAGHQRMPVQPGPRASLEMAQAELLFELLVRLLARPARLDRGGEGAQGRLGRQVAEVVLALAAAAPLAYQPSLVARQVAVVGKGRTVAHPDPGGGEPGGE